MIAASRPRIILVYTSPDDNWRQRLQDCLAARSEDNGRFPAGLSIEAGSGEHLAQLGCKPERLNGELQNVASIFFLISDDLLSSPCVREEPVASVFLNSMQRSGTDQSVTKVLQNIFDGAP